MIVLGTCATITYRGIKQSELPELLRGCLHNGMELSFIEPEDSENYEDWRDQEGDVVVVFRALVPLSEE